MAFFPLNDKAYVVDALSEVYTNYDLNYLRIKRLDKSFDHMFLYDGKDLYFFLDEVTLIVGDKELFLVLCLMLVVLILIWLNTMIIVMINMLL